MTAVATGRSCPKCGSDVYDNRAENMDRAERGEKLRPEFKCKSCEWVKWGPKNQRPAAPAVVAPMSPAPARQATPAAPHPADRPLPGELDAGFDQLFAAYDICYAHALQVAKRSREKHDLGYTAEGVASIAATLIIAAQKKGLA